jgi:hypothetical protein
MRIAVTPGTFRGLTKMPRDAAEVDPVSARNRALRMPRAKKPMPRIDFFDGDMGHGIRQMNKYSLHCIHIQWAFRELQAPLFGMEGRSCCVASQPGNACDAWTVTDRSCGGNRLFRSRVGATSRAAPARQTSSAFSAVSYRARSSLREQSRGLASRGPEWQASYSSILVGRTETSGRRAALSGNAA